MVPEYGWVPEQENAGRYTISTGTHPGGKQLMAKRTAIVMTLASLGLAACVVEQPPAGVLVLPGPGKDQEAFRQDDTICRQSAAQQSGYPGPTSDAPSPPPGVRQALDSYYLQCMQGLGNVLRQAPTPYPAGSYAYPAPYPYGIYPYAYDPFWSGFYGGAWLGYPIIIGGWGGYWEGHRGGHRGGNWDHWPGRDGEQGTWQGPAPGHPTLDHRDDGSPHWGGDRTLGPGGRR